MESSKPYRPRVSRETRLLLTAGAIALAALWLLARFRFQGDPATPNPVPAVLGQLNIGPQYDDLASEITQLRARVIPSLIALSAPSGVGSPQTPRRTVALRLRGDLAVTLLLPGSDPNQWREATILARDPASGLVVVRVPSQGPVSPPTLWMPRGQIEARYLVATDTSPQGVSLRPVFVGSLDPVDSPLWPDPIWAVPRQSELTPGAFVFTSNAELAGLVVDDGADTVVAPGATILAEADRLLGAQPGSPGTVGLDVQALTAPVASVTGAPAGVVVTWVERQGAAAGQLMVGDVIESVDGRLLATRRHWDVRLARLLAGETLRLRVRRRGEVREVSLVATASAARPTNPSLGLTLRGRVSVGAEVVRVEPGSAADRAGLSVGDLITLVGDVATPTPGQVTRSFASARQGQHVMMAVTRGDAHHVIVLQR